MSTLCGESFTVSHQIPQSLSGVLRHLNDGAVMVRWYLDDHEVVGECLGEDIRHEFAIFYLEFTTSRILISLCS